MKYRPDVDGLRAVAVLPVLLFHAGATVFSGGYVGVDIFFVISGYVITGRIMDDLRKRAVLACRFLRPTHQENISGTHRHDGVFLRIGKRVPVAARDGRIPREVQWRSSDIFRTSISGRPLAISRSPPRRDRMLHTWSLSIEEQFYVFIPVLLALSYRYIPRYAGLALIIAGIGSFALMSLRDEGRSDRQFLHVADPRLGVRLRRLARADANPFDRQPPIAGSVEFVGSGAHPFLDIFL